MSMPFRMPQMFSNPLFAPPLPLQYSQFENKGWTWLVQHISYAAEVNFNVVGF